MIYKYAHINISIIYSCTRTGALVPWFQKLPPLPKFYGQTNQKTPSFRRIRSKGKGVARFQHDFRSKLNKSSPILLILLQFWDGISDIGSGIVESEQSFRVADMFLQCIYRRQSPEHRDRVFTAFDLDSGPKLLHRMFRF